jgi:hypothetical protein
VRKERNMRAKTVSSLWCLGVCIGLISGCSGYGRIASQRGEAETVTIDRLVSERGRYDVYFMEASFRCSPVLVFDPKEDGRVLRSGEWEEVASEEDLSGFLYRVRRSGGGEVYLLLGPDDRRFGYLYATSGHRIYSKAMDDGSLELYMRSTPCSSGPGPSGP